MTDQITIKDQEVFCHHGVFKEENVLGQKFLVTTILDIDSRRAGKTDDLDASINYALVADLVEEEMTRQNDALIERVAERLADQILKHFALVRKVAIEVKKPWAPILKHVDYVSVRIERGWHQAYVGVGSNMGKKQDYIEAGRDALLADDNIRNLRMAEIIETEPYGYTDQDVFLNSVISFETLYRPEELLDRLMEIEQESRRTREIHWGPRTLDLDVLLYDDLITSDPKIIIPHPDMHNRTFVLQPLCELNPYGVHPLLRKRYIDILAELKKD